MVGPENSIFRKLKSVDPKKMPLTTEISLHFYFPFTAFPENERERARARARERRRNIPVSPTITGELRAPVRADLASSSPTTAIDASRDRAVDRDLRGNRRTGAREIGAAWSSESAGDRRTDWNVSSPLARTHSLSLSLFPEML